MTDPILSVVIVSWMTGPRLLDCLHAVLTADQVDELVLVSHENPPEILHRLRDLDAAHSKMVLIETGQNLGFGVGCNIGAQAARGDTLLFLNPDTVLLASVAKRLKQNVSRMDETRPWIIGSRLLNEDGSEQRGGRRGELTPSTAFVSFLGLNRFLKGMRSLHQEQDPLPDDLVEVDTVSGAALMIRAQHFHDIGGFDPRYFLHVEDIDICRTAREAGGTVWFDPNASILHVGGTSQSSPLKVENHKAWGFISYFWKFYPGPVSKVLTSLMIPAIFLAIWTRLFLSHVKAKFRRVDTKDDQSLADAPANPRSD
ncbi:glycosyltransferase family 2 protein [Maricaulis sp. D1M11]|uniref:glycosyltransferase family 2 protein n=1 Tax=Maricaulis sp. D1M11 TaxID=3076117 RepID=UPI0039B3D812